MEVREFLEDALKRSSGDYTEIRFERRFSTSVVYRFREMDVAATVSEEGGVVRTLSKAGGWGVTTFNRLGELPRFVEAACECARAMPKQDITLADVEPVTDEVRVEMSRDFRSVALAEKVELVGGYNEALLEAGDEIVDTHSVYGDVWVERFYVNSEGTCIHEEWPAVQLRFAATARRDGVVQRAFDSFAKPGGFDLVGDRRSAAEEVGRRAVALLSAPPVKGGAYTVVLNPALAGVFIHEAFGHLSEADHVYENAKARELMVLGKRFAPDFFNVGDDGTVSGLYGTHRYDDEGVPTRRNSLIKEGVLVGRLHSRETAAKMGETVTGNARAINYRHEPIVRMTNTFIEGGDTSFEDLISGIKEGVYACDSAGGQTELESFSFIAGWGYMIRDGRIAEMVRDVVVAGNLFDTLRNIEALGDDFRWIERAGGCGKGGQSPLPVGMGAPHVRIGNAVIGGRR